MEKQDTVTPDFPPRQTEPLWGFKDVSEYLDVSPMTVRTHMQKRGLPHKRVAGRVYFRRSEIDAWIESQNAKSADSPPASDEAVA